MSLLEFSETQTVQDPGFVSKSPGLLVIDFNQIIISAVSSTYKKEPIVPKQVHELGLITIKNVVKKFKADYPDIVIAMDSRDKYWRCDIAPYYKETRKLTRSKSFLDFPTIYKGMDLIREGLINYFPYIVMDIPRCEADDIAGVLTKNFYTKYKNIMLVSSDSDWSQLQKFKNVKQWSSMVGGMVHPKHGGPEAVLLYKIIKGDRKDAVANILSAPDSLVTKTKQKSITEVQATKWILKKPEEYCNEQMLERFRHNEKILDLCAIPEEYESIILSEFIGKKDASKSRAKINSYLIKTGFSRLSTEIGDF